MKLLFQLMLVCCLATFCVAYHNSYFNRPRQNIKQGDPCTPFTGRRSCGEAEMIGETVTELTEDEGFRGPNVCRTVKKYRVQFFSYSYQRSCFRGRCRFKCVSTKVCNGTFRNFTRRRIGCCEGFTTGDRSSKVPKHYYRASTLRTEGCPVVLRDNIVECLEELNLTRFLEEVTMLQDELQDTDGDTKFTIFAPSDEAFENVGPVDETTIDGHIAESRIRSKRLFNGKRISTRAENVTLHAGIVRKRRLSEKQFFLNGVRISNADACQTRNGIVHVMESLIPLSSDTIAEVLESRPSQFSTFVRLLEGADIMMFLRNAKKSRTVFAPTNEAFEELPSGTVECLLKKENRRSLGFLVLLHIVKPAEYSSTLAQRSHIPTFAWPFRLLVNSTDGDIRVSKENIPIEEADIPANNGVIHALPEVIVPREINFRTLCPAAPSTEPPVEATTYSPTTGPGSSESTELPVETTTYSLTAGPSTERPVETTQTTTFALTTAPPTEPPVEATTPPPPIVPSGPVPTLPVVESSGDAPPDLLPIK